MPALSRRYLVAIAGDASLPPGDPRAELAFLLGRGVIDAGYILICGGRGGAMDEAARGAMESDGYGPGRVLGLLPGTTPDESGPHFEVVLPTGLGLARNALIARADALVAVGGGAGTLSEICLAWQLGRLVIGLRSAGWSGRVAGAPLDHRRRFPHLPEDQVWPASDAWEVLSLLERLLPVYRSPH